MQGSTRCASLRTGEGSWITMNVRQRIEEHERQHLAPYASLAVNSLGRQESIAPCDLRTDFQRDRDRILHCKSFRRLKHKTQCFIAPEGDHFRTRLTHTLEVSQIARTISRALGLNEDLCEAIAMGHDLGHTPFGHMGERILGAVNPNGFGHEEQSVRVVQHLEHGGQGLNLTAEVLDGILNHKKDGNPSTLEGRVVSLSDRIAYINHDIDDAIRAGVLMASELPKELTDILGSSHGERIDTMIKDIVTHCQGQPLVEMSSEVGEAMDALRTFMFKNVYLRQSVADEETKASRMLESVYRFYVNNEELLPLEFQPATTGEDIHRAVTDYVAGMTDRYAVNCFVELYIPKSQSVPHENLT